MLLDWKKIFTGIAEHFLTKVLGVIALVLVSGLGSFKLARGQDTVTMKQEIKKEVVQEIRPSIDSLQSRTTKIMFYLDEIVPDSAKEKAEKKMLKAKINMGLN